MTWSKNKSWNKHARHWPSLLICRFHSKLNLNSITLMEYTLVLILIIYSMCVLYIGPCHMEHNLYDTQRKLICVSTDVQRMSVWRALSRAIPEKSLRASEGRVNTWLHYTSHYWHTSEPRDALTICRCNFEASQYFEVSKLCSFKMASDAAL